MKSKVTKIKLDTPGELLARSLGAAARTKKRQDHLRPKSRRSSHTICLVGFSDTFCALQQICHICVTNLSFDYYIKI